jgi:hypothetical protein
LRDRAKQRRDSVRCVEDEFDCEGINLLPRAEERSAGARLEGRQRQVRLRILRDGPSDLLRMRGLGSQAHQIFFRRDQPRIETPCRCLQLREFAARVGVVIRKRVAFANIGTGLFESCKEFLRPSNSGERDDALTGETLCLP